MISQPMLTNVSVLFVVLIVFQTQFTHAFPGFSIGHYFRNFRNSVSDQEPIKVEDLNATFFFYYSPTEHIELKVNVTADQLNPSLIRDRHLVFITHGYRDKYPGKQWIESMKQMIFDELDNQVNVVIVDWHKGSIDMYPRSVSAVRVGGKALAKFIMNIRQIYPIDLDHIHLIGYSLGAHLSAFAGKHLKSQNILIGQITGLDPAGPMFSTRNCTARLCSGDAKLVTVIHTDSGSTGFGTSANSGDVDIFLNGGKSQPGCQLSKITEQSPKTIHHLFTCNHRRAHQFYIHSNNKLFTDCEPVAYQCDSFTDFESGLCGTCGQSDDKCRLVGFGQKSFKYPNPDSHLKPYYMYTNADKPWCTYLYQIVLHTNNDVKATKIRLEMLINGAKKVTLERSVELGKNVTYLLKSAEPLGRIEHIEIPNGLPNLIQSIHANYLSHSDPKLCPVSSSNLKFYAGIC